MTRRDTPPPNTGVTEERELLLGFLDYLRESVVAKVDGSPEPGVREPGVPSGTNLLGLVHHLTQVERFTFCGVTVADWSATFHAPADHGIERVVADYRAAIVEANAVVRSASDLDTAARRPGRGKPPTLRWALTHLIEETARHAGHLDILRELLDGATGR